MLSSLCTTCEGWTREAAVRCTEVSPHFAVQGVASGQSSGELGTRTTSKAAHNRAALGGKSSALPSLLSGQRLTGSGERAKWVAAGAGGGTAAPMCRPAAGACTRTSATPRSGAVHMRWCVMHPRFCKGWRGGSGARELGARVAGGSCGITPAGGLQSRVGERQLLYAERRTLSMHCRPASSRAPGRWAGRWQVRVVRGAARRQLACSACAAAFRASGRRTAAAARHARRTPWLCKRERRAGLSADHTPRVGGTLGPCA